MDRISNLDTFLKDLDDLFIQHFMFVFSIKGHYMMSSDYTDYRDLGMEPPEDSQYWVAPFIQQVFNEIVKENRKDLVELLKQSTKMKLE